MKPLSLSMIAALMLTILACDDNGTDPEEDYIRPAIVQPLNSSVIRDSIYTILVSAEQNCGCASWVEFYVDSTHVHTDYLRQFSYDLHTADWQGERTIWVHAVVPGSSSPNGIKAEGWDSVRVMIDLNN